MNDFIGSPAIPEHWLSTKPQPPIWDIVERYASNNDEFSAALLSLKHRVELLEYRRDSLATLKQQALDALHAIASGANDARDQLHDFETIRSAINALPD
jgi:hypothetical protein